MTIAWQAAHESHVGRVRSENQDCVAIHPMSRLWAVADGMGGHAHGRYASALLVERLMELTLPSGHEAMVMAVESAIHAANRTIHERASAEQAVIGTTIAALCLTGSQCTVLWSGDSRVYRLHEGRLERMTQDHITLAPVHGRTFLTRAVGVADVVAIDRHDFQAGRDDAFLIASDGLAACMTDDQIESQVMAQAAALLPRRLLELCLQSGAPDNVAIIAVFGG
jgi:serine/threonine protein phosphatase PrpC